MPSPEDTIATYRRQSRRRLRWFVLAVLLGSAAAAVAKYGLGAQYPALRLAVLVAGLLYVPWFVSQVYRRDAVSLPEALRARRELLTRRGGR